MCRICNGGLIQGAVTLKSAHEIPQENVYRNLVAVTLAKKWKMRARPRSIAVEWAFQLSRSGRMAIVAMPAVLALFKEN